MGKAHSDRGRFIVQKILFTEGSHGNFLARCLSVASGVSKDFDFYKNKIGAHSISGFKSIVDYNTHFDDPNVFCLISFRPEDLYILSWHMYLANAEFGLDLLETNNFAQIRKHLKGKESHCLYSSLKQQIDIWEPMGVVGLREMFKKYHTRNYLLSNQFDKIQKHSIHRVFEFSWFYNQEVFITQLKLLLQDLGHKFVLDISHHWNDFIKRKQKIINSKILVEHAFFCYSIGVSFDISKFCIYEQGYLDHLVEQYLGYEIENVQEYPMNTKDINPTKAW